MSLAGHFWTIAPHLRERFRPTALAGQPWSTTVDDDAAGPLRLTGTYHPGQGGVSLLLVHGLGGCADSGYVVRMAAAAIERGHPVLRLNLRGADRAGADIYHAGLTADLRAALASPPLADHRVAVIGFSLGGHVSLRLAAERPAVAAVCSICAPLDLAAGADHIDRRRAWVYRRHLLRGLREIHGEALDGGAPVPLDAAAARRIGTLREWDDRIVAVRFGFAGAADYYARMSAAPVLGDIECPTLIAWAPGDPMVPPHVARPPRALAAPVERRELPGGHVGFPGGHDVERRILDWVVTSTA